jgi:hypothetical protein
MSKAKEADILDDYFQRGLPLEILSAVHGRSCAHIRRLIRLAEAEGLRLARPRGDPRYCLGAEPITRLHKYIGMKLIRWRDHQAKLTPGRAAEVLGVSRNRYAAMEAGAHHWTLLELCVVCGKLRTTVPRLLAEAEQDGMGVFASGKPAA